MERTQGQVEGHFEGLLSSDADVRRMAFVALQRLEPAALEQLFEIYNPADHGRVSGETICDSILYILRTIRSAMILKLGNSDRRVRSAALVAMVRLEPGDLAPCLPVLTPSCSRCTPMPWSRCSTTPTGRCVNPHWFICAS